MRFKQYLAELTNIETGQAIIAHEPTGESSVSIDNPRTRMEINYRLMNELNEPFLSPQSGIQRIRKVLHRHSFDLPALYDADPEGDELAIEIDQFGVKNSLQFSVYILYYLTDEGHYEFYAEVGDDERMQELLSDEGEDEEDQ